MSQQELEADDRTTHPSPPIYITDWLESLILGREADSLLGKRRLGDTVLVDQNVPAGQELRIPLQLVELRHDPPKDSPPAKLRLLAPFRTKSPVADGVIGPDEYGPPLAIDFTGDKNPGVSAAHTATNPAKSSKDLSAELSLAYTNTDLYVAVKVHDDVIIDRNGGQIPHNDAVELFIDGDRLGGDLIDQTVKGGGSREGFQAASTAKGRKYGVSGSAMGIMPYELRLSRRIHR